LGATLNGASLSHAAALVVLGPDGLPESGDEVSVRNAAIYLLCQQRLWPDCSTDGAAQLAMSEGDGAIDSTTEEAPLTSITTIVPDSSAGVAPSLAPTLTAILPTNQARQVELPLMVSTPISNAVNARVAPSTQADILDLLPANTQVPAGGRTLDYAWLHITLPDGRTAWVYASAVITRPGAVELLPVTLIDE
jgi:hypothetical protein